MSKCIVYQIENYRDHPTIEKLKICEVGPHTVVVGDHYHSGQLCFYLPDGAIVPDKLAEEMWIKGKLAGNQKNRVKSREIKGVFSDGLIYGSQGSSWVESWKIGDDVTGELGITFKDDKV